jgi:hypothetical protein
VVGGRAQSAGEGHVGALFSGMNFMNIWQVSLDAIFRMDIMFFLAIFHLYS